MRLQVNKRVQSRKPLVVKAMATNDLKALQQQVAELQSKIVEYQKELDAADIRAEYLEKDSIYRTKHKFTEFNLSPLRSLRDYLERMHAETPGVNVRMAIANFNQIVGMLLADKYVFPNELSKIKVTG